MKHAIYPMMQLRLFVLRIRKDKRNTLYRIAYCGASPVASSSPRKSQSDFNSIGEYGKAPQRLKCSVSEIKIIGSETLISNIFHDLVKGSSIKETLKRWGLDDLKLDYDVRSEIPLADIAFHQEKIFENVTTYVESFSMSDPRELFLFEDDTLPSWADTALDMLVRHIAPKVHLPEDVMSRHIGNFDRFTTTDYDSYGHPYVIVEHIKDSGHTLDITFTDELLKDSDSLTVNVKMAYKDRLIVDSIQTVSSPFSKGPQITFQTKENIGRFEISVWQTTKGTTKLIHHEMRTFILQVCMTMEVIGEEIQVNSEWFDRISAAVPKNLQPEVKKEQTVRHSVKETSTIGSNPEENKASLQPRKAPRPKLNLKSNDGFFPKGWDKASESHGALGFFKWFREITKEATEVVLQDPYIEDVALQFVMLSGPAKFTLITQTALKTNPDGTSYVDSDAAKPSSRRHKILALISQHPTLFRQTNMVIQDITGIDNKLHDRYMFVSYPDGRSIGFTLSNSLQGATMKQPLLVTEIGDATLQKVREHVASNIERLRGEGALETIYDSASEKRKPHRLDVETADPAFKEWLCSHIASRGGIGNITESDITQIFDDILYGPYSTPDNYFGRLSTVGELLASEYSSDSLSGMLVSVISQRNDYIAALKDYVLKGHNEPYPIGFRNHTDSRSFHLSSILMKDFIGILDEARSHLIDYALCEHFIHDNYGQHVACQIFCRVSSETTVEILREIHPVLAAVKTDSSITPVCKLTDTLLHDIFYRNAIYKDLSVMEALLKDSNETLRALGGVMMLHDFEVKLIPIADIKRHLSNGIITDGEAISICKTALSIWPLLPEYEEWLQITTDHLSKISWDRIKDEVKDFLCGHNPIEAKRRFVAKVLPSVQANLSIPKEDIEAFLFDTLFNLSKESDNCLIVLPHALAALGCTIGLLKDSIQNVIDEFDRKKSAQMLTDIGNLWRLEIPLQNAKKLLDNQKPSKELKALSGEIDTRLRRRQQA